MQWALTLHIELNQREISRVETFNAGSVVGNKWEMGKKIKKLQSRREDTHLRFHSSSVTTSFSLSGRSTYFL
jgi:hypothetical protein